MVKKVGTTKTNLTSSQKIEAGKAVETTKVGGVGQVDHVEKQESVRATRRPTRPMTAAEREHLLSLVEQEAEKFFASTTLPKKKRETVKMAVKMVIDAGIIEDDKDS